MTVPPKHFNIKVIHAFLVEPYTEPLKWNHMTKALPAPWKAPG